MHTFVWMITTEVRRSMSESEFPCDTDPIPRDAMDPLEVIGRFAEPLRNHYIARASAWIRRLGIDEAHFAADDAFEAALTDLCRRVREGPTRPIRTLQEFRKSLASRLWECLLDERRRQRAHKRGWGMVVVPLQYHPGAVLDPVDIHAHPPEEHLVAEDEAEWLLALLDRKDRSLRETADMRGQGLSIAEIASQLNVSISTVERRIRQIRTIWAPHVGDHA
jgi:DNA-directed RNA polymerase specialized sigma24 family protein